MANGSLLDIAQTPAWWKEAICYQIYPASFKDSNGDGYGDLNGITSKLDYIQSLGVDLVWLCPIYQSPRVDMGYDISDYDALDPLYGTMEDWQGLVDSLHRRGMKLIMDLVVNHTSDLHPWFQASRSSRHDPKRDWYIWRPAKVDEHGQRKPPNNWASIWGNSAWQWDEHSQEYYLHLFSPQQPDLKCAPDIDIRFPSLNSYNSFESPALVAEIKAMMTRWLKRGIDGFRLDAINFISKPLTYDFPDAPITQPGQPFQPAFSIFNHGPRIHDILRELYQDVLRHFDAFTVGEAALTSPEQAIEYVRQDNDTRQLQMLFQTEHIDLYAGFPLPAEGTTAAAPKRVFSEFKATIAKWQTKLMTNASWQSIYDSNHDQPRPIDNILEANIEDRAEASKLLAVFLCSLAGTLFIFQGEELGSMNVPLDWSIENYLDLVTRDFYNEHYQKRKVRIRDEEPDMADVMKAIQRKARDNARTPMPWDGSDTAGFGSDKPWMKVNPDNKSCNVAAQLADPSSILSFWRGTIALRKRNPVLTYGLFEALECSEPDVFCYTRSLKRDNRVTRCLVILNFGKPVARLDGAALDHLNRAQELLTSNYEHSDERSPQLRAYEARIYIL